MENVPAAAGRLRKNANSALRVRPHTSTRVFHLNYDLLHSSPASTALSFRKRVEDRKELFDFRKLGMQRICSARLEIAYFPRFRSLFESLIAQ